LEFLDIGLSELFVRDIVENAVYEKNRGVKLKQFII